jgi:hypothetical protein
VDRCKRDRRPLQRPQRRRVSLALSLPPKKACHLFFSLPPPPPPPHTVFFYNLLVKLGSWRLFLLYEGRLKRLAKRAARSHNKGKRKDAATTITADGDFKGNRWSLLGIGKNNRRALGVALGGKQVAFLRWLRKGIVYYYSLSDLMLLLVMAVQYLGWGEGQELLRHQQMVGHDPHRYDKLERRVVAFNWCVCGQDGMVVAVVSGRCCFFLILKKGVGIRSVCVNTHVIDTTAGPNPICLY